MTASSGSVATEFTALRRDIAQLIDSLRGLSDHPQTYAARMSDAVEGAREKVVHVAGDARKSAEAVGEDATAYVERNPLTAILIALGLGLLVGVSIRLRG